MQWGNSGVPMTPAGDRSKGRGDPEFLEGRGVLGLGTCELALPTFHTLPTICAAWAGQSPWGLHRLLSQGLYSCPEPGLPT